jgi:PAS domain S-box-containing protein
MAHKICLVAPYKELAAEAKILKKKQRLLIDVVIGNLEEGLQHALKAERKGAQVIISRGGTASLIQRKVKIPVIEIQVTGYDVLHIMYPLACKGKKLAILGYQNVVLGCGIAANILNIPIKELILGVESPDTDWNWVRKEVHRFIKEDGIDTIIGDANVVEKLDVPSVDIRMITSGSESIQTAVTAASHIVQVREEEQKAAQRLQAILDFVHDGIVATDEKGKITVLNTVAERIFRIQHEQVLGRHIDSIIKNTRVIDVIKSGHAVIAQLQKVYEGHILTNRIPIYVDGAIKGVVATFQEVTKIQDAERTIREKLYGKGLIAKYTFDDILTKDTRMKRLVEISKGYAKTAATVLIQGESGTGKELFAQSIHAWSARSQGPFVAINCAALPPQLLESELFGYVEGAFTGAKKSGKIGLFELAHTGTIFLDEIGDMDKMLQARLLRVLADRRVMRIGSDAFIPIDIRIIAATNSDLHRQVQSGAFRKDLYYRINVLHIPLIPLRERPDDIPLLAGHFFKRFSREQGQNLKELPVEVLRSFGDYQWPGNVRELENIIERIVLSAERGRIHLPTVRMMAEELRSTQTIKKSSPMSDNFLSGSYQDIKRRVIRLVLKEEGWNKSRTARRLGIDRTTVDKYSEAP